MVVIVWTPSARQRLREIANYMRREAGVKTARKINDHIYARTEILADNPHAGPREEALADRPEGFRYLVEGNYKIVYYATEKTVYIVTVFDCRRNPSGMRGEVLK